MMNLDPKEKETTTDQEDEARINNMISEGGPAYDQDVPEEESKQTDKKQDQSVAPSA